MIRESRASAKSALAILLIIASVIAAPGVLAVVAIVVGLLLVDARAAREARLLAYATPFIAVHGIILAVTIPGAVLIGPVSTEGARLGAVVSARVLVALAASAWFAGATPSADTLRLASRAHVFGSALIATAATAPLLRRDFAALAEAARLTGHYTGPRDAARLLPSAMVATARRGERVARVLAATGATKRAKVRYAPPWPAGPWRACTILALAVAFMTGWSVVAA